MSRIPSTRHWLSAPAGLPKNCWQPPPSPTSTDRAEGSPSADTCSGVGWLSFRRIVDIPFDACLAALEDWQRTGQDGELHLGHGLLHGPIERDRDSGTCRIQVRLARRPLRPPLLMRLDIDRLSSSRTALELIPCKRARPTAGYFRAGHRLLDSLTQALAAGRRQGDIRCARFCRRPGDPARSGDRRGRRRPQPRLLLIRARVLPAEPDSATVVTER